MASSGWQDEKELARTGNTQQYPVIGNVRVDSISHTGDSLRVQGAIALGIRGQSGGYAWWGGGVWADAGNGWVNMLGANERIYINSDKYASYDITVNVPAVQTYWDMPVSYKACQQSSCASTFWNVTRYWRLTFEPSGNAPSGYSVDNVNAKWNEITFDSLVQDTGGLSITSHKMTVSVIPLASGVARYEYDAGAVQNATGTVDNSSPVNNPDWIIKGCGKYYIGAKVSNSAGTLYGQGQQVKTAPSPSQLTYGVPTGSTYPMTFTGDAATNNTDYDLMQLKRTIRYKIGNGNWTYVDLETSSPLTFVTSFNVTVPAGSMATIEGWQSYYGNNSEVTRITISNTNAPVNLYGSINGQSKKLGPVYASVDGETKKIAKIYASAGGVTKKVYENV